MPSRRTKRTVRVLAGALAFAIALPVLSQVTVADPWARATVPGQKVGGVYMKLTAESDARLVGASSPAAKVAEVHEMTMVDNVMKMRAIRELALPAGRTVELKPGSYHIMLIELAKPLAVGNRIALTLEVVGKDGKTSQLAVTAEVRGGAGKNESATHKH